MSLRTRYIPTVHCMYKVFGSRRISTLLLQSPNYRLVFSQLSHFAFAPQVSIRSSGLGWGNPPTSQVCLTAKKSNIINAHNPAHTLRLPHPDWISYTRLVPRTSPVWNCTAFHNRGSSPQGQILVARRLQAASPSVLSGAIAEDAHTNTRRYKFTNCVPQCTFSE